MIKQPCALGVPIQFGQGTRRKPINKQNKVQEENKK